MPLERGELFEQLNKTVQRLVTQLLKIRETAPEESRMARRVSLALAALDEVREELVRAHDRT